MASTPEGKVKDSVKKVLKEFGAYWFMPVQNGMGAPALDFHCCMEGVAFFIETKAPGKKPTPRQAMTILKMETAGGKCFVIDGSESLIRLREWLTMVDVAHRIKEA